ncbi:MAG: CHAT domain-containing protein [Kibdelosporangium sp.]
MERGDFVKARAEIRAAIAQRDCGQARLTSAWIELEGGRLRNCLREIGKARELGAPAARVRCVNGLRLCAAGAHDQAVTELSAAADGLRTDPKWLANALVGRGIARGYLLRLAAADRDFAKAAGILATLGEHERVAVCVHNRGFVALQGGDVPKALKLFDQAAPWLRRAEASIDHASALLAAGLTRDASVVLDQAEARLQGRGSRLAEAALAAGYCALRSGDLVLAAREARRAQELFRAQRRPAWVAAADALALRTEPIDAAATRRVAERCLRWGRKVEAAELLLTAGEVGSAAVESLQEARTSGTARLRVLGWLARAKLAKDNRALFAACRAGMRVVAENAAVLGAGAAELAGELGGIAVGAATRPRAVLEWVERQRIAVQPSADSADLVALRAAETSGDLRRVAELESRIRGRSRAEPGVARVDELVQALGDKALVSFGTRAGELIACVVAGGRVHVRSLGAAAEIGAEVRAHRNAVLDDKILRPLKLGDRELVVVPSNDMTGLVWAALPSCAGRPVSVAPSARAWLKAGKCGPGLGIVAIAGPGLAHARREARAVRPDTLVTGSTVDGVLEAMDGADVVHIAAHGRFRHDAPMFSCLRLADGPLYGHDLDRLRTPPRVLVLSACEVARSEAFLGRAGQALIASAIPVPDEQAVDLVTALHDRLRAGMAPAKALAHAQAEHGHLGFSCFGSG